MIPKHNAVSVSRTVLVSSASYDDKTQINVTDDCRSSNVTKSWPDYERMQECNFIFFLRPDLFLPSSGKEERQLLGPERKKEGIRIPKPPSQFTASKESVGNT